MRLLVPIDGSEASERALRYAATLVNQLDWSLHVVHITDKETEATDEILNQAQGILEEMEVEDTPSIEIDIDLGFQSSNQIGEDIVELVMEGDYDHVVMGHHGTGTVDRLILGSAAETVIRDGQVPVTVIP